MLNDMAHESPLIYFFCTVLVKKDFALLSGLAVFIWRQLFGIICAILYNLGTQREKKNKKNLSIDSYNFPPTMLINPHHWSRTDFFF